MRLTEIDYANARPVEGYGPGFFRIGGAVHSGPILVTATEVDPWAGLSDPAPLLDLRGHVDVIFIGTGQDITPVPAALRTALEEAGIGVEPMASPTACRTFNVLLSEGRRVAAALIPV